MKDTSGNGGEIAEEEDREELVRFAGKIVSVVVAIVVCSYLEPIR